MKIVTMSRIKHSKIYDYIDTKTEYKKDSESWTINLSEYILEFIAKQLPTSRSAWLTDVINEYVGFLEKHDFGILFTSRSELIRHAVIEKMIFIMDKKNEEIFGEIETNKIVRIPRSKPVREFKMVKLVNPNLDKSKTVNKPWEYTKPKKFLNVFPREINFNLIVSHLNELKEGEVLDGKEIAKLIGCNSNNGYGNSLVRKINERIPNLITVQKTKKIVRGRTPKVFTLNREVLAECL